MRRPSALQRFQRLEGPVLDGVGHDEQAGEPPVGRHEQDRLALAAQLLRAAGQRRVRHAELGQEHGIPQRDRPAIDLAAHAFAGDGRERGRARRGHPTLARPGDDRRGQRMFAALLQPGRQP